MAETVKSAVAVVGIDIGKNSFHIVGLDRRGAIVLRQRWSRGQVEARLLPAATEEAPQGNEQQGNQHVLQRLRGVHRLAVDLVNQRDMLVLIQRHGGPELLRKRPYWPPNAAPAIVA